MSCAQIRKLYNWYETGKTPSLATFMKCLPITPDDWSLFGEDNQDVQDYIYNEETIRASLELNKELLKAFRLLKTVKDENFMETFNLEIERIRSIMFDKYIGLGAFDTEPREVLYISFIIYGRILGWTIT